MGAIHQYLEELIDYAESPEPLNNLEFAMNQMKSSIKLRLFNSNGAATDINGINAGGYSKGYKAKRLAKGRQVQHKDFNLTDNLVNSFKTVVEERNGKNYIIIYISNSRTETAERNRKVAGYLTEQTKKKKGTGVLFGASKKELEERDNVILKLLKDDIEQIGQKYSTG
jgi:hypothetical protein